MGCSCKGNNANTQTTQVTKRNTAQTIRRNTTNGERKQIIIRRNAK